MTAGDGGRWRCPRPFRPARPDQLDVGAIRRHFAFPGLGRIVTNNAASTQPPRELLALYASLGAGYENVHRGQSSASMAMTALYARETCSRPRCRSCTAVT